MYSLEKELLLYNQMYS